MFEQIPSSTILKKTLKHGGELSELFFEQSRKTLIVCDNKKIETISSGVDCGAGLRLINNQKSAYGFTNDLSVMTLNNLAEQVSFACKGTSLNSDINLKKQHPTTSALIKTPPDSVSLSDKISTLRRAEKLAWSLDNRIVQVKIRYSDSERHVEIANSLGNYVVTPATHVAMSIMVTASNGTEFFKGYESIGGFLGFEIFHDEAVDEAVHKAVRRALLNMSARKADGGIMPVVISSNAGGTMVHEAVGHGLEADLACEGMSVYQGQLEKQVASPLVNIVDDPTLPQKRGFYLFDDEGAPAMRTSLIENGILKSYMHNQLSALKNNTQTNGHGRRESYAYRPIVRMSNTYMLPGTDNPEEIIASTQSGLFVKMMGGGEVNTVNGDFVFEVTEGYRIENGKIGEPVRGATLTGNGPAVLKMIDKVGDDLGFSIGTCGKDGQSAPVTDAMPTVRIPEMVVGGNIG